MAFYKFDVAKEGWTGVDSFTSPRRYTVVYQLQSNDPDDGPERAKAYFASEAGLPSALQSYSLGNDNDPTTYLTELRPVKNESKSSEFNHVWDVTCQFTPIDDSETSENESGQPVSDPLQFRRRFDITFAQQSVDANTALFIRCIDGLNTAILDRGFPFDQGLNKYAKAPNTEGPVVNSTGRVYDPPTQKTESDIVLRIGLNTAEYDQSWWDFRDSVNQADILLNDAFFGITNWRFPKWTLRVETIDSVFRFVNGVRFWENTFIFHYRGGLTLSTGERTGWSELIPDYGFHQGAKENEADGEGGNIPALQPAAARWKNIVDPTGNLITEPIALDGSGLPLQNDGHFWNQYLFHEQADFTTLPAGFTLAP